MQTGQRISSSRIALHFERLVAPETARVAFSKALTASVTGSLNDIVRNARFFLAERGLSPFDTARMLARCPMGALGYAFPNEAFATMPAENGVDNTQLNV